MVEVGKYYMFSGSARKVVKVTESHVHMVWANGQVPARMGDRTAPISLADKFIPIVIYTQISTP